MRLSAPIARVVQSLIHVSHVQTDAFVAVRFSFFSIQVVCFLALIVMVARHATSAAAPRYARYSKLTSGLDVQKGFSSKPSVAPNGGRAVRPTSIARGCSRRTRRCEGRSRQEEEGEGHRGELPHRSGRRLRTFG